MVDAPVLVLRGSRNLVWAATVGGHPPHQIQALDRTQPGLPMKPGRAGTMTHDYKRHGTTTLFAALNVLDGSVIGRNMQRHRIRSSSASSTPSRRRIGPPDFVHMLFCPPRRRARRGLPLC